MAAVTIEPLSCLDDAIQTAFSQHVYAEWQSTLQPVGVTSAAECLNFFLENFVPKNIRMDDVFVALHENEFAGCVAVNCTSDPYICFLYVVPQFRNLGYARAMVTHACDRLRNSYSFVFLSCSEDMTGLYNKFGFQVHGSTQLSDGEPVKVLYKLLK